MKREITKNTDDSLPGEEINPRVKRFAIGAAIITTIGLVSAIFGTTYFRDSVPTPAKNNNGTAKPFAAAIVTTGTIEPLSGIVELRTPIAGVVQAVHTKVGQRVRRGDPLVTLDTRHVTSELAIREAQLKEAQLTWQRLSGKARIEEVSAARARVDEARARVDEAARLVVNAETLSKQGAISQETLLSRQRQLSVAQAQVAQAVAAEQMTQRQGAGTDLAIATAKIQTVEASIASIKTELERHVLRAPFDGEILRIEVVVGTYLDPRNMDPLIVFGDLSALVAVVDIDEHELWRFSRNGKTLVSARGHRDINSPAEFIASDQLVIAQQAISGKSSDRFDARALRAKFKLKNNVTEFVPGQLVDVFIESRSEGDSRFSAH
ncbi:MAG: HlyD family secretion protein [Casimicrobium sp.]